MKLQATEISYDNTSQVLGIKKSTLSSTALKNTTLTLTEGKVSKDGLDWTKLSVTQKSLDLGGIVKLEDIEGRVKGKGDDYAFDASAGLGLNLSSEDIGSLTVEGKASLGYANKALTYGFEGVSVTGEIPKVLKATATDIHYDQNTKALKVSKVTVKLAIPKLKETSVEATGAKITNKGIDWDQVRVTGPDIPFGDIFKVAKPTVIVDGIVDGAEKNYSIYLEGGATLKFGKYLEGGGTGGIKIDRTDNENPLKIEKAGLTAKGQMTLPGQFMKWPNISFEYPLIPGVLGGGLELIIKGGLEGALTGSIDKKAEQPVWDFAVSPEITGSLTVGLAVTAATGSSYVAAIQAYLQGTCTAAATGSVSFKGKLTYDGGKIKADQLTAGYSVSAGVTAEVSVGVKAKAFYFFEKKLYSRKLGEWNLGEASITGKIILDEDGKLKLSKPEFGGLLAGPDAARAEIQKNAGRPAFSLIASDEEAEKLLLDASKNLPGVGEERRERIKEIKKAYEAVIKDANNMIEKEAKKAEEYKVKLTTLLVTITKYEKSLEKMHATHEKVLSKKASLTQKEISPENSPEKTHQPETKKKINHSKEKNSKDNKIKQEPYHPESSSDKDKNKSSSFSFTGKAQNMLKKIETGVKKLDKKIEQGQEYMIAKLDKGAEKVVETAVKKSDTLARSASVISKYTGFYTKAVEVGQEKKIFEIKESYAKKERKLKLHDDKLELAKETKKKADEILKDVEAAILKKEEELEAGGPMKIKTEVDESEKNIKHTNQELEAAKQEVENSGLAAEVNELVSDIQALDQELNQEINALKKELKQTPA